MFRFITKVTIHKLPKDTYDRCGRMVTFDLEKVPNMEYIQIKALNIIWTLTSLLSERYSATRWKANLKGMCDYFSEGNECWITVSTCGMKIVANHKYWSNEQIQCFRELVLSTAKLHEWEVADESQE